MMETRKQLPISFSKSSDEEEIPQIIFALSTTKSLEPFLKLRGDGPQAVYLKLTGNETYVKCFDLQLSGLEMVEGLSKEKYMIKAEEMSRLGKPNDGDSDTLET